MRILHKIFKSMLREKPKKHDEALARLTQENTFNIPHAQAKSLLKQVQQELTNCADISYFTYPDIHIDVLFFEHLVKQSKLNQFISDPFRNLKQKDVPALLKRTHYHECTDIEDIVKGLLAGDAAIFYKNKAYLVNLYGPHERAVETSETETIVNGPRDAFVENCSTNLSLLRRRIKSNRLKVIKLEVGELSKTTVYLLYVDELVDQEMLVDLKQRIEMIEVDVIFDTHELTQLIEEKPNSIFPKVLKTERPDVAASKLAEGKIVGLFDGSPYAFSLPTNFFEFFQSPDDYNGRWIIGTTIRIFRYIALIITIIFTALYVAVTTYHYEMLPGAILVTIAESRARVPFPPIYEALIMEFTIELLREAGIRLPTKIGQTIGIVGGIVIGQAAVDAGITSNILIISVAVSAIASFVIPSYIMSASIRIARFGIIILAAWLGIFGIALGVSYIVIQASGITSLKAPYLEPLAPMYIRDWKDTLIRSPFQFLKERPVQSDTRNKERIKMRQ